MAASAFKKFVPLFDRVLVEKFSPELVSKGGIILPEKTAGKILKAKVVATGPGMQDKDGEVKPVNVNIGDQVLLPEYGGTKVEIDDVEYYLFRDSEILGKFET